MNKVLDAEKFSIVNALEILHEKSPMILKNSRSNTFEGTHDLSIIGSSET